MSLSDNDKDLLRQAAAEAECDVAGCNCGLARQRIADHLRLHCPGIADADLALVLLHLAGPLSLVSNFNGMTGAAAAEIVAEVAAELAALEIGGRP